MTNLETFINAMCECVVADTTPKKVEAIARLKQLMAEDKLKVTDPEGICRDLLMEMGAPDHLIGYDYAVDAICMVIEDRRYLVNVVKELYPAVAAKYNAKPCRVERGIRHLVKETMERGKPDMIEAYFGNLIKDTESKATNSEFIARMANIVKQKIRKG